jgi:hypothetical protein
MNLQLAALVKVVKAHAKAIAAILTPALTYAATKWGLNLSPGDIAAITSIITGGAVYAIPNA